MIHIRLPILVKQELKANAALENKSITQLVRELIEVYLEKKRATA